MNFRCLSRSLFLYIFLLCLLVSRISAAGYYDPSLKYKTIKTEHFAINYPEKIEDVALKVAKLSEEVHHILSPKYDWKPWGRTQVVLVDSSDVASGAASVLPYNWMFLRVAAPPPDHELADYNDWLRMLIMHEYTHILHLDKAEGFWVPFKFILGKMISPNGVTPGWIVEGYPTVEETIETKGGRGRSSFSDMLLRTAILKDEFLPIDVADGVQWKWPAGTSRYIYGVKFLQYLADKYGKEKIYEFVERVSSSPLLFMANHQARHTFSDMEFETEKIHNRYVKRKKRGAPKSKTFYKLWDEWKSHLEKVYGKRIEKIKKEGETEFHDLSNNRGIASAPAVSPDGSKLLFTLSTPYGPPELKEIDLSTNKISRIKKKLHASEISFSPEGNYIIYSKGAVYKRYQYLFDLYKLDLKTKKTKRLTKGKRIKDPDISPDGKTAIAVAQNKGTSYLELFDIEEEKLTQFSKIDFPQYTQFSSPKFSPDGSMIAVSVTQIGNVWDIYLFNRKGKIIRRVTDDYARDRDPFWGPNGRWLYFVSDRTGISNIYRYNIYTRKIERITNVLTGVFEPVISPDGRTIYAKYYNGEGYDIRKYSPTGKTFSVPKIKNKIRGSDFWLSNSAKVATRDFKDNTKKVIIKRKTGEPSPLPYVGEKGIPSDYEIEKYSPFGMSLFLPRFIIPGGAYIDDGILVTGMTGGADPLKWHNWLGGVSYRTDAKHLGYNFNYWYNRYRPRIDLGVINYAVNFGTVRYQTINRSFHLYEKRLRGYAGIGYPIGKHSLSLSYFYEDRNPKATVALTQAELNYYNFGVFSGFNFRYTYNDIHKYKASITRDGGRRFRLGYQVTNSVFGSDERNEQHIILGDYREYLNLPGRYVWALRASGGIALEDQIRQGTFTMGGDMGESMFTAGGSLYYFPLRGLPVASLSRSRALLFSSEFRIPLMYAGRGLGTMPVFLNDIYMALFADYGNAWNKDEDTGDYFFDNFFLGVGAELAGNFVIGHGLPITGRIGYGIIVVNRDRLGSLKDPLFGQSAKKGLFILQLGTSF